MSYWIYRSDYRGGLSLMIGSAKSVHEAALICDEDKQTIDFNPNYSICYVPDEKEETHNDKPGKDR